MPPRAEVGLPFYRNTTTISQHKRHKGGTPFTGRTLPCALCWPVVGLL